ncbi:uncharacterized protein LOC129755192 [Uranotaenia lowii]|uniref:uncharacterized protein LOC129755192 n=1 Tax=Uranotaenia lowii TaxID=190385 RepID=UPI00247AAA4E|nr:uncharacterized protein LOC129755192 [Uranotaenia lowii]
MTSEEEQLLRRITKAAGLSFSTRICAFSGPSRSVQGRQQRPASLENCGMWMQRYWLGVHQAIARRQSAAGQTGIIDVVPDSLQMAGHSERCSDKRFPGVGSAACRKETMFSNGKSYTTGTKILLLLNSVTQKSDFRKTVGDTNNTKTYCGRFSKCDMIPHLKNRNGDFLYWYIFKYCECKFHLE